MDMKRILPVIAAVLLQVPIGHAAVTMSYSFVGIGPDAVVFDGNGGTPISNPLLLSDGNGSGNNVTISFNGGPTDTLIVNPSGGIAGLAGTTPGNLVFLFSSPINSLSFTFEMFTTTTYAGPALVTDAISGAFQLGAGASVPQASNLTISPIAGGSLGSATMLFGGIGNFDRVSFTFATDSGQPFGSLPTFGITSSLTAAVPEPTSAAILAGLALCGFAGWRRMRNTAV
jgi:hypothetical protein